MEKALLAFGLLILCATAYGKQSRTYYDAAAMERLQRLLAEKAAAGNVEAAKQECAWLLQMSDQELWDFIPPPEQMRAINVCIAHDCPVCGDEITRKAGHYPWITSREEPFKLKCPVCSNVFPKNDFKPWNTEGLAGKPAEDAEPTDNGLGWLDQKDGRRYYFVPYYIFWQRWSRDVLGGLNSLSRAYLLSGDARYAHKAGVMLSKIGGEYERFDYPKQCYHEGRFGVNGRIMDYIWSTGNDSTIALAYDAVYPAVSQDAELTAFLQGKQLGGPTETVEKMLWLMVQDVMSGYVAGNQGMHQLTLANLAIVLDNDDPARGPTKQAMVDWIMRGPGRTEDLLYNGFYREGLGAESSPGYSSGWCQHFYDVAELLPRLGLDIWANPKLKKMADIGTDLTIAGKFSPSIGDSGRLTGTSPIALTAGLQGPAFRHYKDPKYARMLKDMGASPGDLFNLYYDAAEVEKAAATAPALKLGTRNLGGYGCAILETGEPGKERALSLYYGDAGGGHGHYDRLNVEMFSHGQVVMPEDGYPTPFTRPDFYEWRRSNTYRHYSVMIDELPQLTLLSGDLNTLAAAPEVQLVDAEAYYAYPEVASLYRRTSALIDISPEDSYLLDLWRVRGGEQHDWCYHAGSPEMTVTGGELSAPQAQGTLAGETVEYGKKPAPRLGKQDLVLPLQTAKGVVNQDDYWKAAETSWSGHCQGVLTTKAGMEATLKLQPVPAGKYRLFLQYWDHKPGLSEVELTIGQTVIPVKITTAGGEDWKWQSQIIELPAAADSLKLKSISTERGYIMINRLVLGTDLTRETPQMATAVDLSSGFQGLRNVQRMKPAGPWTATWNHWTQKDLAVTMTMPAGCAQEVIVADGEPEAQTGNPRTIKYALARNQATGPDLLSKYVAVVEPHVGPAQVQEVKLLTSANAAPETVGVEVRRGEFTDLVHSGLNATATAEWQGAKPFAATAEFALVTLDAAGVQRAMLVNGTSLSYGDFHLTANPSPAGKVLSANATNNTIVVDQPLPAPEAYVDRVITFANDLQRTSYTIKSAEVRDGHTILGFGDILFTVGMAMADKFDDAQGLIFTASPLAGYGKVEGGRHGGRWLLNEDKTRSLRIVSASGNQLKLEQPDKPLAEIYTDADGDGRRQMWTSDIGPGDSFQIPAVTWVQRTAPGVYKVQTMTLAELSTPR